MWSTCYSCWSRNITTAYIFTHILNKLIILNHWFIVTWKLTYSKMFSSLALCFKNWVPITYNTKDTIWGELFPNPAIFIFKIFRKTVLINFLFKFVLGTKLYTSFNISWACCLPTNLNFLQIIFLELCSSEIWKLFQNPAIWIFQIFQNPSILLIHYFQKKPTELVYQQIIYIL